jgi:glycosyltransferase involved in cell wall biosynthesis
MGEMKTIILTVTNDLSYDQRMQKICRSLAKAGYAVQLVGRERSFSIPLRNESYRQTRLKCIFNKGKLFYVEFNLRLLLYLLFSIFDAACAVDLDTIVPVVLISKLKGAKIAYDAHEYFTEVPEVINRPRVKKAWQWVEKTFVPKCDLAYTVSPQLSDLFVKKYRMAVDVILNVPLLKDLSEPMQAGTAAPQNPPYLLYQGALNEGRGLEHLIEAMQGINAQLKIAGEGDLSESLRQLVSKLQLQNKVQFMGFVEPAQLKELTAGASIGFNLLENKGLSYYYSLSNKFFDYIHARVPQVCINFPAYKALNDKYKVAVLVDGCTAAEVTIAVNLLLQNKELYATLKKNCEVCSAALNWQAEEVKLLGLYERLFR